MVLWQEGPCHSLVVCYLSAPQLNSSLAALGSPAARAAKARPERMNCGRKLLGRTSLAEMDILQHRQVHRQLRHTLERSS